MAAHPPRLGAWLFCLAISCTRNDSAANAHPTELSRTPMRSALPDQGQLPRLDAATAWLNTDALTRTSLRGEVVLVQFWTYSCINWRRTLP